MMNILNNSDVEWLWWFLSAPMLFWGLLPTFVHFWNSLIYSALCFQKLWTLNVTIMNLSCRYFSGASTNYSIRDTNSSMLMCLW
jgi:hypothetical protein